MAKASFDRHSGSPQESPSRDLFPAWWEWVLLLLVVGVVIWVRVRLLSLPLERDEGEYAYGGQLLRHGGLPYRDLHSMKWPGIYVAYAACMSLFGETISGIHAGLLLLNLATALGAFLLVRELTDARSAAYGAACLLVWMVSTATLGVTANAEHFAIVWAVFGLWMLARSLRRQQRWGLFLGGLLLGLGPVMKQHAILFVALGIVLPLLDPWPPQRSQIRGRLVSCGACLGGVALVWVLMAVTVWSEGIWSKFYLWTIVYASNYTAQVPLELGATLLGYSLWNMLPRLWPLFAVTICGLAASLSTAASVRQRLWGLGVLLASAGAICPGLYFRQHYYLFFAPAVAVMGGLALHLTRAQGASAGRFVWASALLLSGCVLPLVLDGDRLFLKSPEQVAKEMFPINPFVESVPVAAFIRENSAPDDRIVIFGSEPQICFYAGRRSATGFVYMYPMMENHPLVKTMQRQMISEVSAAQPEIAVYVDLPTSWTRRPESEKLLLVWMNDFLKGYEPCGYVRLREDFSPEYHLGEAMPRDRPSHVTMVIFKRKTTLPAP